MSNKFVREGGEIVLGREAGRFYDFSVSVKKGDEGFSCAEIDSKIIIHINILT